MEEITMVEIQNALDGITANMTLLLEALGNDLYTAERTEAENKDQFPWRAVATCRSATSTYLPALEFLSSALRDLRGRVNKTEV